MARPLGAKNKKTQEGMDQYDLYASKYGVSPMEFLFQILSDTLPAVENAKGELISTHPTLEMMADAAKNLIPYKHPKLSSTDVNAGKGAGGPIQLVIDMTNAGDFQLPTEAAADSTTPTH